MRQHLGIFFILLLLLAGASFVGYRAWTVQTTGTDAAGVPEGNTGPVAVELAEIETGLIRDVRVLSGSLEARAWFTVAAKVGGLIEGVFVDIGDRVERDKIVAEIDDAEFVQAVAQAEAELGVRKAERSRAESDRDLAQRDYDRALALQERGIASESQLDETSAALASAEAALELAQARVTQAEASLELSNIRLRYADVKANWSGGPDTATVAERYQDAGNTVQSGDPIVAVAVLDPLTAVVSVTEGDYAQLSVGQPATLVTDARPGEMFDAEVARIAPVFREASRQARIELRVENPDRVLRPGMFIRVRVVLQEADAHTIVPGAAIVQRGGQDVVFTVNPDGNAVTEHVVETGIVQGERVQVTSPQLSGRIVVLGQQLLEDGAPITISDHDASPAGDGG